ncbi:sulfotransferase 1C2-like [Saccoglossus kowalevskii]|uniref:Sulfotransferase 1C2-like n=1 Tax=Saccoglossus kowalevskii TaxID=10224 RepID=A0ABM0GN60_SACKO|nr:PREDICTED: sulfotransferase 1C2-like [Saccoglossus kowalevskii]
MTENNELQAPFEKTYYVDGRKERLMVSAMHPDSIKALKDFEVRDDDVYIVTYPKAGTTFILEIVDAIMHRGDIDAIKGKKMEDKLNLLELGPAPGIDVATYKKVTTWKSPRQLQTHLPRDLMPPQLFTKKPRIIFVTRNPRDCCLSLHQWHATVKFLEPCEWDYYFDRYIEGQTIYGCWFEHLATWMQLSGQDNFLHLKYEDMKEDRQGASEKVAKFLGYDLTPEEMKKVVDHTDFNNMKEYMKTVTQRDVFLRENRHWQRKGTVGGWKGQFTVAQNEKFEEWEQRKCKEYGIDFIQYYSKTPKK